VLRKELKGLPWYKSCTQKYPSKWFLPHSIIVHIEEKSTKFSIKILRVHCGFSYIIVLI